HKRETQIASSLFLVFPGYSQHWVALTHINQEWIPFIFYLLSFGYTARAMRNPQKSTVNTILALLFLILGVFPTEYFLTIEPLRFLFIWVIVAEETKGFWPRLIQTMKRWWPYLLVWFSNVLWLDYYYKSGAYISYGVTAAQQTPSMMDAIVAFGDALWKAGLYIWAQVLVLISRSITTPTSLLTLVLIFIAFLLLAFYFLSLDLSPSPLAPLALSERSPHFQRKWGGAERGFVLPAIVIGLIGILLGRIPSFAAGLPLTLQSSFDRFMVSMMLGAILFIAGLIELIIRNPRAKTYVFALLIALGIGQQFFNANIFRRDWQRQQEIYWQMAWRIPALKPNTVILTDYVPIDYESDLSFTAPINWMYARDIQPPDLPYAMLYLVERLGGATITDLKPGTAIQLPYRTLTFHSSTSQAIVINAPANECLHVFDPAYKDAGVYGNFPDLLPASIPLSDPSRILTDAPSVTLPSPPFSKEPDHTWCYFYEKADLARQTWNEAPKTHKGLCALWKRVQLEGPNEAQSFASGILSQFGCGQ